MHSLNMTAEIWREVLGGFDDCGQVAGSERCRPPMVGVHPIWRRLRKFLPIDRGNASHYQRPRVRVGCRLAREVSGIELGDGGREVVEVKCDVGHQLLVVVDLDDAEKYDAEFPGFVLSPEDGRTT